MTYATKIQKNILFLSRRISGTKNPIVTFSSPPIGWNTIGKHRMYCSSDTELLFSFLDGELLFLGCGVTVPWMGCYCCPDVIFLPGNVKKNLPVSTQTSTSTLFDLELSLALLSNLPTTHPKKQRHQLKSNLQAGAELCQAKDSLG